MIPLYVADIERLSEALRENNQKAVVVICTDGESTDGDLADAMKPLQYLPVLVVVRLCTDEDETVEYWNGIDEKLEIDIDVLDDFRSEAVEVQAANGWLTYGEPMHRLREFGCVLKECDLIDENLISSEQMRSMCAYLLGDGQAKRFPCPDTNFPEFCRVVRESSAKADGCVYDPVTNQKKPWVNLQKVCQLYRYSDPGGSAACNIM